MGLACMCPPVPRSSSTSTVPTRMSTCGEPTQMSGVLSGGYSQCRRASRRCRACTLIRKTPYRAYRTNTVDALSWDSLTFSAGPKSCIGLNFALLEISTYPKCIICGFPDWKRNGLSETVLATLVSALGFMLPADHEIEWRFGATITPSVKGERGLNPYMPLRVEVL